MKKISLLSLGFTLTSAFCLPAVAVERPPQYVVLAFDGSKSLPMWDESRQFADDMTNAKYAPLASPENQNPSPKKMALKFTYFINSNYFLASENKRSYLAPQIPGSGRTNVPGASAIGFGGTIEEVEQRFVKTNQAYLAGNEIANHAAGHYDGTKWTRANWHLELREFYDTLFNIFDMKWNGHSLKGATANQEMDSLKMHWKFGPDEIIGFRAPQLGNDQAMYEELPSPGYEAGKMDTGHILYDTSQTTVPQAWPTRKGGMWQFALASIPIVGTVARDGGPRKNLAMDFNFYFMQTNGKDIIGNLVKEGVDPAVVAAKTKQLEDQMYYSYVNYFFGNYNGNRAPVNIGHHFSKWNGGAYWNAMRRFAKLVCGLPEVRCSTYKELKTFMEEPKTLANIAAYRAGKFEKTNYSDYYKYGSGRATPMPVLMNQTDDDYDPSNNQMNDPAEAHE